MKTAAVLALLALLALLAAAAEASYLSASSVPALRRSRSWDDSNSDPDAVVPGSRGRYAVSASPGLASPRFDPRFRALALRSLHAAAPLPSTPRSSLDRTAFMHRRSCAGLPAAGSRPSPSASQISKKKIL